MDVVADKKKAPIEEEASVHQSFSFGISAEAKGAALIVLRAVLESLDGGKKLFAALK